jgi:hypothetical protein
MAHRRSLFQDGVDYFVATGDGVASDGPGSFLVAAPVDVTFDLAWPTNPSIDRSTFTAAGTTHWPCSTVMRNGLP